MSDFERQQFLRLCAYLVVSLSTDSRVSTRKATCLPPAFHLQKIQDFAAGNSICLPIGIMKQVNK